MKDEARFKYFLNIEFDFINYPIPFILLYPQSISTRF